MKSHRRAVDPGAAITTAMLEALRSGRLFSAVAPYDGHDRSDFLMTGRLEKLDAIHDRIGPAPRGHSF